MRESAMTELAIRDFALTGRRALVTGAARGIGRAVALELAAAGADVVINYAGSKSAAEQLADECRALGVRATAIQADISKGDEVAALFAQAVDFLGGLDILVNNAGITRDGLLLRLSDDDIDAVLATNLRGAMLCARSAAKIMLKQRAGRIVSISSVVALRGNAGQVNYAAAKAGLIGMSKSLARELAGRGITVNVVAPGFISTDMTATLTEAQQAQMLAGVPMGRAGEPQDVAAVVRFLASDAAAYITGQVLSVDGGMAM